jgi:hypothetical protein
LEQGQIFIRKDIPEFGKEDQKDTSNRRYLSPTQTNKQQFYFGFKTNIRQKKNGCNRVIHPVALNKGFFFMAQYYEKQGEKRSAVLQLSKRTRKSGYNNLQLGKPNTSSIIRNGFCLFVYKIYIKKKKNENQERVAAVNMQCLIDFYFCCYRQ